jgi:glycosyltransferase involved in cell wall biosynthesis
MKLIDLSFYHHPTADLPQMVNRFSTSYQYIFEGDRKLEVIPVLNLATNTQFTKDGCTFHGFKGTSLVRDPLFGFARKLKKWNPDIVMVHGLVYPEKIIALRMVLGHKVKIVVQHHGGLPSKNGIKKFFHRIADSMTDAYFFTSQFNSIPWQQSQIIHPSKPVLELLEASTFLNPVAKDIARKTIPMEGNYNFLWVGRLHPDKDPITVLKAFEKFALIQPDAKLFMIFQSNDLLNEINEMLSGSAALKSAVQLVGKIDHSEIANWYGAADYFISGSHHEGSGYALIEALACGLFPVVSSIPPFIKITNSGEVALLFETGDHEDLFRKLVQLKSMSKPSSDELISYFQKNLSFKKIADTLYEHCRLLVEGK